MPIDFKAIAALAKTPPPLQEPAPKPVVKAPLINTYLAKTNPDYVAKLDSLQPIPTETQEIVHYMNDLPQPIDMKSNAVPDPDIYNLPGDIHEFDVFKPAAESIDPGEVPTEQLRFFIPADLLEDLQPSKPYKEVEPQIVGKDDAAAVLPENCSHMCSKCSRLWTHGPISSCRFPDKFNSGPCQNCLNGEEVTDDFELDDRGQVKLLPSRIAAVRNAARLTCENMTIEQLSEHIVFNAKRIAELQADSMEARKLRSEKEEEALLNIPESEREAFRQALRKGSVKKEKKVKSVSAKETQKQRESNLIAELSKEMPLAVAKLVASTMIKTNKTRAEVEAWLND